MLTAAALLAGSPLAAQPNAELERKRLELDIERLERDAGASAQIQRWLPALSALVAAGVAVYGILRYLDERRRAKEERVEDAVTRNLERLTERPSDANLTARAITALRDLDRLAPAGAGGKAAQRRDDVKEAVTAVVSDDLIAFETRHHARLPVICLERWPEFKLVAVGDVELCKRVLARYTQALAAMRGRAPVYVQRVERRNGGYTAPGSWSLEDALLLPALVEGFEAYLELVPEGTIRTEAIERFSASAEWLGRQLFGAGR